MGTGAPDGRRVGLGHDVHRPDAYLVLGTTKLAPHLDAMRRNVGAALATPVDRVSVKARTNDGLGPDGEGRACSAHVVVLLRPA